ncbi:hypothetical protein C808_05082 [Lachnospiraceae bacterium M18-1]|nr:hypothetical protein C808_05082 [Lachnospiraceae bacterium M18-1]
MATDYSVYQSIYSYMNTILGQLQSLGTLGQTTGTGSLYSSGRTTPSGMSFGETFQSAAGRLGVPESMDAIFKEAAEKYHVPVNLLMAVGKAESGFNPDAVSSAGAQGVMQLMPSTAAALGVENAFDARSNIMGGAKYLSQKLQQYNGDIDLTLAAYNAGSGNVEKYGGVPPFDETINYIRRIREYMGQELSTGRTVTGTSAGQSRKASGTLQNTASDIDLTQQIAEYFVGMMRLQMMSRVSTLGLGSSLGSTDSDGTSLW